MFFICSSLTKKIWICSLLFRGQRTLTLSAVNWMMSKRRFESPQETRKHKRPRLNMESSNHTHESAGESQHASPGNIKEIKGDLFTCPATHSLAHCISADVKMGKGIAVMFKDEFGGVTELRNQRQGPGGLAVLNRGDRFVYYLVTKGNYWDKPTYNTLYSSLVKMRDHNKINMVTNLCMPKIGCGLDRLQWNKVLNMIRDIYKGSGIQITIYHYEDDKKEAGKGRGYQRTSGGYEQDWRRDHRDQPGQRNNSGYSGYPDSGTRYPPASHGEWFPERDNFRQARSARQPSSSGENQVYGPELPNQSKKGGRGQTKIEWPTLKPGDIKQNDKETCKKDNDESRGARNPQEQESKNKNQTKNAASAPVKINREPYKSGGHQHDGHYKTESGVDTQDRRRNDGARKETRQVDDNARKVDGQNKGQKDGRDDDQLRKVEKGSQETSKNDKINKKYEEKKDDEGKPKTTNSKERRKERRAKEAEQKARDSSKERRGARDDGTEQNTRDGSRERRGAKDDGTEQNTGDGSRERRNESNYENQEKQTHEKGDDVSQDKYEEREQGEKLNVKQTNSHECREDTTEPSAAQNDSRLQCKSQASDNESTMTTLKEHGTDCKDDGDPSGSHDETEGSKKKKKKKKKKNKNKKPVVE